MSPTNAAVRGTLTGAASLLGAQAGGALSGSDTVTILAAGVSGSFALFAALLPRLLERRRMAVQTDPPANPDRLATEMALRLEAEQETRRLRAEKDSEIEHLLAELIEARRQAATRPHRRGAT